MEGAQGERDRGKKGERGRGVVLISLSISATF